MTAQSIPVVGAAEASREKRFGKFRKIKQQISMGMGVAIVEIQLFGIIFRVAEKPFRHPAFLSGGNRSALKGDFWVFPRLTQGGNVFVFLFQVFAESFLHGLTQVGRMMQEIADYSLQFPILALRHYAYTGDKKMLRRTYETCDGIVAHFRQFERSDGLLQGVWDKWNLVDWPKNLRDGYDFPLESKMPKDSPPHNVLNAFYIGCVLQTEKIARILGIGREERGEALKDAFHCAFYNEKTGLFTDCEGSAHSALHSNVIPAFYGINRPERAGAIRDLIVEKGLSCGVYMAYFVLKALCKMGYLEEAYRLIVNTTEHSWYNMVREGATTCFEAWGKDQKWNTSLCHPWASAPVSVLAEDILPALPQYGRIVYKDGSFIARKEGKLL